MIYKRLCITLTIIGLVAFVATGIFFNEGIPTDDEIYIGIFSILVFIQKYSWPFVTLLNIYAMYDFYVLGSKFVEKRFIGQRFMLGLALFLVIVQCLPLIYGIIITFV